MNDWDESLVSAHLDGELSPSERESFERVIAADPERAAAVDEIGAVRAAVRALRPPVPPEGFLESLVGERQDNVVALAPRRHRRLTAGLVAAAAAAALILAVAVPGAGRAPSAAGLRCPDPPGRYRGDRGSRLGTGSPGHTPREPMRRVLVVGLGVVVLTGLLVMKTPVAAAGPNPSDALLDRARAALAEHEFDARVSLRWWDGRRNRRQVVSVAAVDGTLRIADGDVVAEGGRAWVRSDDRWRTLWADPRDPQAPPLDAKYTARTRSGPVIAGRPTRQLVIRHGDVVVEKISVDEELGIVLGRERLDGDRVILGMRFVALRDLRTRRGDTAVPKLGGEAPRRTSAPSDVPRRIGEGFLLVDVRRISGDESLRRYSDGVFEASVFVRDGRTDWSGLPANGEARRLGTVHARRYGTPAGWLVVFESDERTYTVVTDATTRDQVAMVTDLNEGSPSAWTRFVRSVTGPFRWE